MDVYRKILLSSPEWQNTKCLVTLWVRTCAGVCVCVYPAPVKFFSIKQVKQWSHHLSRALEGPQNVPWKPWPVPHHYGITYPYPRPRCVRLNGKISQRDYTENRKVEYSTKTNNCTFSESLEKRAKDFPDIVLSNTDRHLKSFILIPASWMGKLILRLR